jgi:ubiquinone/menaquinone biosynthesis C-methylase UbiE
VIGLDIAPNMLAKARAHLGEQAPYAYLLYDGVNVPLEDQSLDLIYSVAALQHVPRPFVFNLFFEVRRLLREGGYALMHFMSVDCMRPMERFVSWRDEVTNQITGVNTHWHHYYTRRELEAVLSVTGFTSISITDDGEGALVACVKR